MAITYIPPKPKTMKREIFCMTGEMVEALTAIAKKERTPKAVLVREAVEKLIKEKQAV